MNNTFDIQRFFKLLNKHTRDNYKTYLMSAAVMAGILAIGMGLMTYGNEGQVSQAMQGSFYFTFLLVAGTIFTSMVFSDLGDKKKAIPALTLPVSHFEKFLVGWLYSFVIFQVVFTLCFVVVDLVLINIGNSNNPLLKNEFIRLSSMGDFVYWPFVIFGLLHAVTFLGAIYFQKLHFIKAGFALFVFAILLWLADQPLARLVFGDSTVKGAPFVGVLIQNGNNNQMVEPDGSHALLYGTIFAVTFLLWTAAFFKLKEKQV